ESEDVEVELVVLVEVLHRLQHMAGIHRLAVAGPVRERESGRRDETIGRFAQPVVQLDRQRAIGVRGARELGDSTLARLLAGVTGDAVTGVTEALDEFGELLRAADLAPDDLTPIG